MSAGEIIGDWHARITWKQDDETKSFSVSGGAAGTPFAALNILLHAVKARKIAVNWFTAEIRIIPLAILGVSV